MRLGRCSLAALLLVVASPLSAAAAPRGVRLTWFADPATTMAVSWNSDSAADTQVSYGTSPAALTMTATGSAVTQAAPLGTAFTAKLTGLEPGTTYYYRVAGHPAAAEAPFQFTTMSADPCAPFRFIVIGDNRSDFDGEGPNAIWDDILAETLAFDPAFYVNTGDMVKNGDAPQEWSNFVDASEGGWALVPSILTMGNHDEDATAGETAIYNQLYELGRNPDGVEDYYSIDVGPIHFVSLNTQHTNPGSTDFTAQTAWLGADLAGATRPWNLAFFHKAIYSRGNHFTGEENTGAINLAWVPLFDQHDVDVVFNGHSHNYERYAPSVGVDGKFGGAGRNFPAGAGSAFGVGAVLPDGATATSYVVTGGAGALTTEVAGIECIDAGCTLCLPIFNTCDAAVYAKDVAGNAVYEGKHNFIIVDVDGDTMTFTVRTTTAGNFGTAGVVDSFTMTATDGASLGCGQVGMPDGGVVATPDAGGGATPDAGQGGSADATPGDEADAGPTASADKSGGCGCRSTGGGASPLAAALLVLALGIARRRRD